MDFTNTENRKHVQGIAPKGIEPLFRDYGREPRDHDDYKYAGFGNRFWLRRENRATSRIPGGAWLANSWINDPLSDSWAGPLRPQDGLLMHRNAERRGGA